MSQVNVIFAVNQTTWDFLKQNFQRDENGDRLRTDLTDAQARKLRSNVSGYWKVPNIGGTNYYVVSWYIPEIYVGETKASGLKWLEFLLTKWPNKFHVIGAWHSNGFMFGTVPDENGDPTGTPVYPIHPQYMKIFPDVEGIPATVPVEVNKIAGWKDRRWS